MAYHYENLRLEKGMYSQSGRSFAQALEGKAVVDKQPKLEGRSMMMFLSPSPTK